MSTVDEENWATCEMNLASALLDYYKACRKVGIDFEDRMIDILFDATGGKLYKFVRED